MQAVPHHSWRLGQPGTEKHQGRVLLTATDGAAQAGAHRGWPCHAAGSLLQILQTCLHLGARVHAQNGHCWVIHNSGGNKKLDAA